MNAFPSFVSPIATIGVSSLLAGRSQCFRGKGRQEVYEAGGRSIVDGDRRRGSVTALMGWGDKKKKNKKKEGDEGSGQQGGSNEESVEEMEGVDLKAEDIPEELKKEAEKVAGEEKGATADDILNSPMFLKKKLEIVQKELIDNRKRLDELEENVEKERDSYMRLAADFKNFRERSAKEISKTGEKSVANLCKEFMTVLDTFERASNAIKIETEKEEAIQKSYQGINKQLLDIFGKLKVEAFDAVGTPFDPRRHDAIQRIESSEYAEGVVVQQFQRGYAMGEYLIRPAMVVVSAGPGPAKEESAGTEKEEKAIDVKGTEDGAPAGQEGNGNATSVEPEMQKTE